MHGRQELDLGENPAKTDKQKGQTDPDTGESFTGEGIETISIDEQFHQQQKETDL